MCAAGLDLQCPVLNPFTVDPDSTLLNHAKCLGRAADESRSLQEVRKPQLAARTGTLRALPFRLRQVDRVGTHAPASDQGNAVVERIRLDATAVASESAGRPVTVRVNQADQEDSVYLTLTGTSAEAGDDGQVGRGNRFGGLITPYRPMSLEAAAGKNPAAHVGKTYHAIGSDITDRLLAETDASEVTIRLLSSIGHPVTEPQAVHVETAGSVPEDVIRDLAHDCFDDWSGVTDRLIDGRYELY